jgi:hypothetical protein
MHATITALLVRQLTTLFSLVLLSGSCRLGSFPHFASTVCSLAVRRVRGRP